MEGFDALRARIRALEGGYDTGDRAAPPPVALGVAVIDAALGGGLMRGRVHEMTGPAADGLAAAVLARCDGAVVWCCNARRDDPLYPPGLAALGMDPARVLLVSAHKADEALWVTEEALSSGGVAAVVTELDRRVDLTASRRLQLAAEKAGTLGVMLVPRGRAAQGMSPNALSTRWQVTPQPLVHNRNGILARWRLALVRQRGGGQGQWSVNWHGAADGFSLATPDCDRSLGATTPEGGAGGGADSASGARQIEGGKSAAATKSAAGAG